MQSIAHITDIESRVKAIGMNLGQLARRAGIAPATAYRLLTNPTGGRMSTLRKLTAAIEAEEQRVADHLKSVRPELAAAAHAEDAA